MRVLVMGATGFIGRALIPRLQCDRHAVVAWVRSPARARGLLGAEVELVHADTAPDGLVEAIDRSDAVVNLAGEPLMGGRWTAARRAVLEGSRIAVTEQLVRAMAEAKTRPRVFVSGSAVGYYGDQADELLTEASSGGDDFLARLCRRWESAAEDAHRLGVRVVLLRTGVVLGLYDLDIEAAQVCRDIALPMARAATVNDDPLFLEMMADEVLKTWDRYRTGRPLVLSAVNVPPEEDAAR